MWIIYNSIDKFLVVIIYKIVLIFQFRPGYKSTTSLLVSNHYLAEFAYCTFNTYIKRVEIKLIYIHIYKIDQFN